jgi:hypothetical protein
LNPRCRKLFEKAKNNPGGLRLSELKLLCACIGMMLDRVEGSHHIFKMRAPFFLLSVQKMKDGKAKAYQVRQLIDFIGEYDLDKQDKRE